MNTIPNLILQEYHTQLRRWPESGNVLQAQFNEDYVVVYQAYNQEIAQYAVTNQKFGGPAFKFDRVSWIKPNFTWMMYRCGWCGKQNQERVLAIRLTKSFFDLVLASATNSTFRPNIYASREEWQTKLRCSDVVLQWDPDHEPFTNEKYARRAIQLGLRPNLLQRFAGPAIVDIQDITDFVKQAKSMPVLCTPLESVYPVEDPAVRERLQITGESNIASQLQ